MPWNPDRYKNVNWNTGPNRGPSKKPKRKLMLELHKKWAQANGYEPQASSDKLQAASLTNRIKGLYRIQTERNI